VSCFFAAAAAAQEHTSLPSLSIREGNQSRNLDITFLGIDVNCRGHLAEITYEVEFLNTTRRNQEGEQSKYREFFSRRRSPSWAHNV